RPVRPAEDELREARDRSRQLRHLDAERSAHLAGDVPAPAVADVGAVARPELVDDRPREDARPAGRHRDRLRLAIEDAEVGQARAAVAAGALEGEGVGIAALPADAREDGVV